VIKSSLPLMSCDSLALTKPVSRGPDGSTSNNLDQVEQLQLREDGSLTISDPTSGRFSDRDRKLMYEGREGKQYVAIVSTGGSFLESPVDSDALTVFALP
jgi:hypothetical protein